MQTNKNDIQRLVGALMYVVRLLQRGQKRGLSKMGLDPSAIQVLEYLAVSGPARPQSMAQDLDMLASSITRHVQNLEHAGYVTLASDPVDRRSRLVSLTEQGQAEIARLTQMGLAMFTALVSDWQPEEIQLFATLLERMASRMAGPHLSQQELQAFSEQAQENQTGE